MKKIIVLIIALMLLMSNFVYASEPYSRSQIDSSNSNKGIVTVKYTGDKNKKIKVIVEKDNLKYFYTLHNLKQNENFPLQMGEGNYKVTVLENVGGNRYRPMFSNVFIAKLTEQNQTFLQSVQSIEWNESMNAIIKAKELTQDLNTDEEKVKVLYDYVVKNFKYDFNKINTIPVNYIPDIEEIFKTKTGICYDFSSILAGMLRSVGVPAKLVKGYSKNVVGYHAWNEVYLNEKWVILDTSYDSQLNINQNHYKMIKDDKLYQKKYEY
ncbi:MAG: transglutaminase-like domain-containing protein [Anaerovoracaceae bacterium]|jgi:hypothetical protein